MKEYSLAINGNRYTVQIKDVTDTAITAEVNGEEYTVDIDQIANISPFLEADEIAVTSQPNPATLPSPVNSTPDPAPTRLKGAPINAPIPGQIIGVSVSVGDKVMKGQKLLTLEAMKLENAITASQDGSVKELFVAVGDIVSQGQSLIAIG